MLEINNTVIKLERLSREINNCKILDEITFELAGSSFVALLGPSGSGKTTLLNILGLMDDFSGEYYLFGNNVSKYSLTDRAKLRNQRIGFIFQSHHLLPELTLYENIFLSTLISHKESFDHFKILEKVGLKDKANNFPFQLSAGELQRGAFARAIINKPDIILADEPTGNLDNANKEIIFNLLREYSKEYNATVIVASHDETVKNYADVVFQIRYGRLL